MSRPTIVHVIEDDDTMRESLVVLLGDMGFAVREYSSAVDFLERGSCADDSCIVSDVRMPEVDGIALCRRLRAKGCLSPLVLITAHADVGMAVAGMKAGAVDFLEKPFDAKDLRTAIEAASTRFGRRAGDKQILKARNVLETLTSREIEVLTCLAAGESNKTAAVKLGLSPRTVEFHRAHIMDKTGAKGLPDLVRLWMSGHPEES